jgi:membrane protease YdiL (CAAX protease family)
VRNPYRAILRREYPEPLIALLAFILGVWLWDHYFGKPAGYPPGTEQIALVKIDRDLRLAEAMAADPAWLRWLAGVDEPPATQNASIAALEKLSAEKAMTPAGLEAYSIILAKRDGLPIRNILIDALQGHPEPDIAETTRQLANRRGTWWHAYWLAEIEGETTRPGEWRQIQMEVAKQLRQRAIAARSSVWLLCVAGLAFLPRTLRLLASAARAKPTGYSSAWSPPLGLVVFLVATLAWIGFTMTLEIGIATLPGLHPLAGILLDATARMLPALIAVGLLFRSPSHAVRVLGMGRSLNAQAILGMFSLLAVIDIVLRQLISPGEAQPGGGLSPGEAGIWGLAFMLTSACLLAPLAEEILYRGVLFRSLWGRLGTLPAAVISSAIFALLHFYDGYGLASVGIFGIACAMLYAATGSLATCIGLHVLYNTAIKLPEWIVYHAPLG